MTASCCVSVAQTCGSSSSAANAGPETRLRFAVALDVHEVVGPRHRLPRGLVELAVNGDRASGTVADVGFRRGPDRFGRRRGGREKGESQRDSAWDGEDEMRPHGRTSLPLAASLARREAASGGYLARLNTSRARPSPRLVAKSFGRSPGTAMQTVSVSPSIL